MTEKEIQEYGRSLKLVGAQRRDRILQILREMNGVENGN